MKKLLVVLLILSIPAFPAKVYISSDQHVAKKVYVTSHREKAQMLVYFVKDQNQANKPFLWFKVNDRNMDKPNALTISGRSQ
jgi:hypothetical protein